jgi:L-ascorbate metabolism protein UlaG (beta-lactamase superfamily)
MTRYLSAVLIGLVVSGTASAAGQVTIRWHGQSFFEIESSKGTRIVLDPHRIEAYGRKVVKADLLLLSHLHNDHTQVDVIEDRTKVKIIPGLKVSGRRIDWNEVDEQFRDVHVRSVGVYHDTVKGMERGKNTVFLLDVDGLRFVHLGDLGHLLTEAQVKQIGPVDVLMIPVGGVYTINGSEAKQVVEQLKPRQYILPMHYGTKVFEDLLPPDEFLDEQKKEHIRRELTNKLTVEAGAKPDAPKIVLLHWAAFMR